MTFDIKRKLKQVSVQSSSFKFEERGHNLCKVNVRNNVSVGEASRAGRGSLAAAHRL